MDIYKYATQNRLRFASVRGELTVENLFEMALKRADGFDLDSVARGIAAELKTLGEESFVETVSANPRKKVLDVSLEILKDVIATKVAENAARENRVKRAELRKKLNDAIAAKQDQQMSQASIEDLQAQLAALDS